MEDVKISNLIKLCTLILLTEGPRHGYEIIKALEERLEKKVSASHIYPFLETLMKNKLVTCKEHTQKNKKTYRLTAQGKAFAITMINRFGNLIDIAIEPRLTTCVHCGCKVYEGGYTEIIKKKKLTFCCRHCAGTYKKG